MANTVQWAASTEVKKKYNIDQQKVAEVIVHLNVTAQYGKIKGVHQHARLQNSNQC
jgi:hypothetical protein